MKKQVTFSGLTDWQKELVNAIEPNSGKIYVVKSRRQCYKTTTSCITLIKTALEKKCISCLIEPSFDQSIRVFKQINTMLEGSGVIASSNASLKSIEFVNGSEIVFKSAEQADRLRGVTVSGILIVDEAAFIKDDIFSIIYPMVDVHKAPIILLSTPLFKDGTFYKYFIGGVTNKVKIFDWTARNDTKMDDDTLEFYRSQMPYQKFLTEYVGEFIEFNSDTFGEFKDVVSDIFDNSPCEVVSIDWSTLGGNDYTAVTALNEHKQMILCEYWNLGTPQDSIDRIVDIINRLNPKHIIVEKNSIGNVFGGLLKKAINKPIKYFITTNDSKNRIINQLQVAIQKKDIQLLNDKELLNELVSYQIEKTNSGKITFNAKAGHHDDIIMSLAIGLDKFIHKGNINLA